MDGAWSAKAATDYMNTNLAQYNEANKNMIELIICNNDNMAEGAISALEAAGYNTGVEGAKTIPVFGVDATDAAKELIAAGKMTGTVKQDAEGMAAAIREVVKAAGEGTAMQRTPICTPWPTASPTSCSSPTLPTPSKQRFTEAAAALSAAAPFSTGIRRRDPDGANRSAPHDGHHKDIPRRKSARSCQP